MNTTTTARLGALTLLIALTLSGCATPSAGSGGSAATEADGVTVADAWTKSAEEGMSAAFGTLSNSGDDDVTVVSVASDASPMLELHETVANDTGEMVMREVDGGFVIPAGGTLTLEPGGSHIMLMDLAAPLKAGDEVAYTMTFSDGSTLEFATPVKDYEGANETYQGEMDMEH